MEAVMLCAGYGTRLYPLTKNIPKSLLNVDGAPILSHIAGKIEKLEEVGRIHIVTNDFFYGAFASWAEEANAMKPITVLNDGTKSNEGRLGAVKDVHLAISKNRIKDDVLIIAGDNLFEFGLQEPLNLFKEKKSSVIVLHDVADLRLAGNYGVVNINEENVITKFEEKPKKPSSTLVSTGVYFFTKKSLVLIGQYLKEGNNPDKTGNFIEWAYNKGKIYGYVSNKLWYDIGSREQLEAARKNYKQS